MEGRSSRFQGPGSKFTFTMLLYLLMFQITCYNISCFNYIYIVGEGCKHRPKIFYLKSKKKRKRFSRPAKLQNSINSKPAPHLFLFPVSPSRISASLLSTKSNSQEFHSACTGSCFSSPSFTVASRLHVPLQPFKFVSAGAQTTCRTKLGLLVLSEALHC